MRNPTSNKDLPPVPSERPPFLITSLSGSATPLDAETLQKHHIRKSRLQDQTRLDPSPDDTQTQSEGSASSSNSPDTDVDVRQQPVKPQPKNYQPDWHSEEERGRAAQQVDSGRTSRLFGHRRNISDKSTEGKPASTSKRLSTQPEKDEHSPPLTGKDSAYSSVSGASVASPKGAPPRSASSASSQPQAQFGLFPSSARSTPKDSISGRFGTMSPASSISLQNVTFAEQTSRPETASSSFSDHSTKKISKRSSFISLKRLFTKKRTDDISSIPE
jgi:hypothetical protein